MRWRIGFLPADPREPLWWHRFVKTGYAHCWAARRLGRNMWLWVEWCPAQVAVGLVPTDFVRQCSLGAHRVLIYDQPPSLKKHFRIPPMPFHHCAGLVAHVLGLRIWAMTPWKLACELRRRRGYPLLRPDELEADMGGSAKARGPSQEELDAQAAAKRLNEEQLKMLEEQRTETAAAKAKAEEQKREVTATAANDEQRRRRSATGTRALLSGDWGGFQRGGDLGAR